MLRDQRGLHAIACSQPDHPPAMFLHATGDSQPWKYMPTGTPCHDHDRTGQDTNSVCNAGR